MSTVARTAARGVAWNLVFGLGARVVQLVGTLVLTRFLAPDAYGAVLAASITVATTGVFTSFAFGQYLIAQRAPATVAFQAAVVHNLLGVATMGVVVALRHPLAALVDSPSMAPYVVGFAAAHLLDRLRYVPERLLMRDLRFRTIAAINGSGELLFTAAALALVGREGAWAIVWAALARAGWTSAWFLWASPRAAWLAPSRLEPATLRALLAYGVPITVAAIADRAATRWDSLLMSKLFGSAVMGRYNLSYSLAEMPISNVAEHIGEVLMPSFSRMEPAERRSAAVRSAALMALLVAPLGVGLGAVAPTIVEAFFDPRWAEMAPMLTILSVMTVFRPTTWSAIAYLQAVGRTRPIMLLAFARALAVLGLVALFGLLGGPLWACVGACIAYAGHAVATIITTGALTDVPTAAYLVGVARPLLACVPMFVAVEAARAGLTELGLAAPAVLALEITTGAVVFVLGALVLAGPTAREFIRLARRTLSRRG